MLGYTWANNNKCLFYKCYVLLTLIIIEANTYLVDAMHQALYWALYKYYLISSHWIFINSWWTTYYYTHISDEETKL